MWSHNHRLSKRQFAYEAHTAHDEHGDVLETVVTPGNVHDSVAFDDVYDKVTEKYPEIETSSYKRGICQIADSSFFKGYAQENIVSCDNEI